MDSKEAKSLSLNTVIRVMSAHPEVVKDTPSFMDLLEKIYSWLINHVAPKMGTVDGEQKIALTREEKLLLAGQLIQEVREELNGDTSVK